MWVGAGQLHPDMIPVERIYTIRTGGLWSFVVWGLSMQGFSRYDAMIRLTRSIRYTHLRSCGHLTFVGAPLEHTLTLVGWPLLTIWVESSDGDADIFAYLEDQDPDTGKAR